MNNRFIVTAGAFLFLFSPAAPISAQSNAGLSSYVTWAGQELRVGDTLRFGSPAGDRVYTHFYSSQGEKIWPRTVPVPKTIIKNFRTVTVDGKQIVLAVIPAPRNWLL